MVWITGNPVGRDNKADAFQTVLNEVAATDDASMMMRSCCDRCSKLYSAIEAHFGLAYERYAHFTSPIRRLRVDQPSINRSQRQLIRLSPVTETPKWCFENQHRD